MAKVEFEWGISDRDEKGLVMVRCRIVGEDLAQVWGPMPHWTADAFVRAKRSVLDRTLRTRADAIRVFTPQPGKSLQ